HPLGASLPDRSWAANLPRPAGGPSTTSPHGPDYRPRFHLTSRSAVDGPRLQPLPSNGSPPSPPCICTTSPEPTFPIRTPPCRRSRSPIRDRRASRAPYRRVRTGRRQSGRHSRADVSLFVAFLVGWAAPALEEWTDQIDRCREDDLRR